MFVGICRMYSIMYFSINLINGLEQQHVLNKEHNYGRSICTLYKARYNAITFLY